VEEIEDEEFHDAIDIELEEWDPSRETYPLTEEVFPEIPELLPCENDEEDLEEVRVAYIRGLPLMWDHHERLTDEHIPEEFTFKTRNRTVSNVPNSPRFIFNPVLANRKTTMAQTLAEEASLLKKKKTFEEIVPTQFHMYKDVFDKSAMNELPPSHSYDHHIRMKDTYEPK